MVANQPDSKSVSQLGEPFNPSRKKCGFYPPDVVGRHRYTPDGKVFKDGPKRVYEFIVRRIGDNDSCWYGVKKIAEHLGKCERQVRYDIQTLESLRLIHVTDRHGTTSLYKTLWHEWLEVRQDSAALAPEVEDGVLQDSARLVRQDSARVVLQDSADKSYQVNCISESSSIDGAPAEAVAVSEVPKDDDESPSLNPEWPTPEAVEYVRTELRAARSRVSGEVPGELPSPDWAKFIAKELGGFDVIDFYTCEIMPKLPKPTKPGYALYRRDVEQKAESYRLMFQEWVERQRVPKPEKPKCSICKGKGVSLTYTSESLGAYATTPRYKVIHGYECGCPAGIGLSKSDVLERIDEHVRQSRAKGEADVLSEVEFWSMKLPPSREDAGNIPDWQRAFAS